MNERRWIKESVLLFTLPVTATTVAFFYEAGYARYFGIPLDLIALNWTAAALAFLALNFVFQLSASWGYLLALYIARWKPWVTAKTALVLSPSSRSMSSLSFNMVCTQRLFGLGSH